MNTHKFSTETFLKTPISSHVHGKLFDAKWKKIMKKKRMETKIFHALQPQIRNHRRTMCDCIVRLVGKSLTHTHSNKRDEIN